MGVPPSITTLLGGNTPAQFFTRYWQKELLLVRAAWPEFRSPLSPAELAGLACEPDVESRIIQGPDPAKAWKVLHGPFDDRAFAAQPTRAWTLLVQDVEKHLDELFSVIEPFRFIPDWRRDDLMVSYAAEGGSVGPHCDAYDVFLLQGAGRRRWQVGAAGAAPQKFQADLELRILSDFDPCHEWVLSPGDMLYLPPDTAHHGVALDSDCMTYSIGFRAPTWGEMIADLTAHLSERTDPDEHFTDPDLSLQAEAAEITAPAIRRFQHELETRMRLTPEALCDWLGRHLTEPKENLGAEEPEWSWTAGELRCWLRDGNVLCREPSSRFSFIRRPAGNAWLFVDGERLEVAASVFELMCIVCRVPRICAGELGSWLDADEALLLLLKLYNKGFLIHAQE